MCEAPARVWDVRNKGAIVRGFDADLVLVDLHKQAEVRDEEQETKCRWSPWHGTTLTGWPVRTWVLGQEVFREGKFARVAAGTRSAVRPRTGRLLGSHEIGWLEIEVLAFG